MTCRVLVIGVGKMGLAHLQVLAALKPAALAGWAPSDKRRASVEGVGAEFLTVNLEQALKAFGATHVIIATPVETLAPIALQVMKAGVRHILLEKPAALTLAEGRQLMAEAEMCHATVCVGYNRRFYSSVRVALSMIKETGERIESVLFEFNEVIANANGPVGYAGEVQQRWLLANSLHVIDTALFPVGHPDIKRSQFLSVGSLAWHSSGKIFAGAGQTEFGVPFAYHANWGAPGRWGFEWMTPSVRYVFRPLERLSVMRKGSFTLEEVATDDEIDTRFKPGVFFQNRAFLSGDEDVGLVSLAASLSLLSLGGRIAGYDLSDKYN